MASAVDSLTAQRCPTSTCGSLEAENLHRLIIANIMGEGPLKAHFWPFLPPLTPVLYYTPPSPASR